MRIDYFSESMLPGHGGILCILPPATPRALGSADCWVTTVADFDLVGVLARRPKEVFVFVGAGPAAFRLLLPQAHYLGYQAGEALATAYVPGEGKGTAATTESAANVTLEVMTSGTACLVAGEDDAADLDEHQVLGLRLTPSESANPVAILPEHGPPRPLGLAQLLSGARPRNLNDILDQHQAIYDELLASQEWPTEREQAARLSGQQPLSALELTKDLAGWASPRPGSLRVSGH